jgi:hypothetical protein
MIMPVEVERVQGPEKFLSYNPVQVISFILIEYTEKDRVAQK